MKKTFHDKLEVKLDEKGRPLAFSFSEGTARRAPTCANGRHPANYKVVNILRWWREPGRWWEGEPVTLYLRLQVSSLLRRPAVMGGASLRQVDSQRQMSAPVMPVIFEIYRTGEKWYFHRLLG